MEKKQKIIMGLVIAMQVILAAGIVFLCIQNLSLSKAVKEYVASGGQVHDIYDDTAVVEAYESGDDSALGEQDRYVLKTAKQVIEENITEDMSDYEKEKAVYDWLIGYTAYSEGSLAPISSGGEYSHEPYGVFKYHEAICVGNATTMKLFLDMLGIENQIIHSTEQGEHAWNLVKLDGEWYHCDVTFDGGSGGVPAYTYFNVPDSVKDDGSYPWNHEVIPAADGTKYCLIANEAEELDDVYAVPAYVKEQLEEGKILISFRLKDSSEYTQAAADLIAQNFPVPDGELSTGNTMIVGSETIYTFCRWIYSEGGGNEDTEVLEKLQEIIYGLQ
ncbi:MAG: transglutaminase domain-containing protein [Emergencia sp.]